VVKHRPRRLLALLVGSVVVLAAATTAALEHVDGAATIGAPADRISPPGVALLVSDSAWLGLKNYAAIDAVQGFDHMLDLGSCRRRVARSCTNYDDHVPITMYEEIAWRGRTTTTLIVATGYNDGEHNFVSDFEQIIQLTRSLGYERVVWLTLRDDVAYRSPGGLGFGQVFSNNNATLKALVASGNYPEVTIADWSTYANDHPEWFATDGIHVRRAGPWAAADYISRKMAFIEGRACAQPVAFGQAVQNPCPDPDVTGLQADLDSLYPVGEPFPADQFFIEWEGQSSWPDPPWWAN
jgi:hypothetical protein